MDFTLTPLLCLLKCTLLRWGVDRDYNLYPVVIEVGFSQQAVGMIRGRAQCGEGNHRDDIPTL